MHKPSHITVCGHFGKGMKLADGQTVKTQITVSALKDVYGSDMISISDTYHWTRNPIKMLISCIKAARKSSDVVILPADRGIFIFVPLFSLLARAYNTRIHYSVIGGWLSDRLKKSPYLIRHLNNFTTVQVETELMKEELDKILIKGVHVVPNFKSIEAITKKESQEPTFTKPLPLCTFSRVERKKGIEDAIEVVTRINSGSDRPRYTLDIYGAIAKEYEVRFAEVMKNAPREISYKGVIDNSKSVDTLKNYYLLLFPTRYATEGLPGTIIDSYAAGVPVLSARWNSFSDVISEGKTGYGFELGNNEQFYELLIKLEDARLVMPLKNSCLDAFTPYSYNHGCLQLRACIEMPK